MADQQSTGSGSPTRTHEPLRARLGRLLRRLANWIDPGHSGVRFDFYQGGWIRQQPRPGERWLTGDGDGVDRFYTALRRGEQGTARRRFEGPFRPAGVVHRGAVHVPPTAARRLGPDALDRMNEADRG